MCGTVRSPLNTTEDRHVVSTLHMLIFETGNKTRERTAEANCVRPGVKRPGFSSCFMAWGLKPTTEFSGLSFLIWAQKLGEFRVVRLADLQGAAQCSDAMRLNSHTDPKAGNSLLGERAKMLSPQPLRAAHTSRYLPPSSPRLRHPFNCPCIHVFSALGVCFNLPGGKNLDSCKVYTKGMHLFTLQNVFSDMTGEEQGYRPSFSLGSCEGHVSTVILPKTTNGQVLRSLIS